MKLEEFIAETIKQILNGVKSAQSYATENGGSINPPSMRPINSKLGFYDQETGLAAHEVEFDIAITTKEEDESKNGVGVFVSVLRAGVQTKSITDNISENRIKFSIPIFLPTQKT